MNFRDSQGARNATIATSVGAIYIPVVDEPRFRSYMFYVRNAETPNIYTRNKMRQTFVTREFLQHALAHATRAILPLSLSLSLSSSFPPSRAINNSIGGRFL